MPGEIKSAPLGIAVYCGSSLGKEKAFQLAAISVGKAIGTSGRSLVYGGGKMGLMGVVSGAVMEAGGHAIGVRPYAMVAAGGEQEKAAAAVADESVEAALQKHKDQQYEQIVVNSMQERKAEMAMRSSGFIALPGGFGTWEEFCEAGTWTQLAIHQKPIILINVLGFYDLFRSFIHKSLESGFIQPQNLGIFVFVDAPSDGPATHETFDWGAAALAALDGWKVPPMHSHTFDWTLKKPEVDGRPSRQTPLDAI